MIETETETDPEMYHCEGGCGFTGAFAQVAEHELVCAEVTWLGQ